jgi:hypothetical protein
MTMLTFRKSLSLMVLLSFLSYRAGDKNKTEDQWVKTIKNAKARTPMPWYTMGVMHEQDFRDLCHPGPAGEPAPEFLPPSRVPSGPYVRYPQP